MAQVAPSTSSKSCAADSCPFFKWHVCCTCYTGPSLQHSCDRNPLQVASCLNSKALSRNPTKDTKDRTVKSCQIQSLKSGKSVATITVFIFLGRWLLHIINKWTVKFSQDPLPTPHLHWGDFHSRPSTRVGKWSKFLDQPWDNSFISLMERGWYSYVEHFTTRDLFRCAKLAEAMHVWQRSRTSRKKHRVVGSATYPIP